MPILWQDARYAARTLRKTPGFTLAAVAVLALGIGATTAMFNLVDAAFFRPLSFRDPDRLVMLWERAPRFFRNRVAPLNLIDWSEQSHSFASMAGVAGVSLSPLTDPAGGIAEQMAVQTVTSTFFDVLGVTPLAGRLFVPSDAPPGPGVVVVSERLWRTRFGADPALVGRAIRLGSAGQSQRVIGIVSADVQLLGRADVWVLIGLARTPDQRRLHYLQVIARLKPGITLEQSRADMAVVAENIERIAPETNKGWGVTIDPLRDAIVGDELRTTSLVLAAVVLFVLLLACANVANLLLARGVGRAREVAVRAALGGSRTRIVRQLLTESVMLAALGGVGGIALSWVLLRVAPSLVPPRTIPESIVLAVDWRLALFAVMLTFATALLFGVFPAWHAARVPLAEAMSAGGRASTDRAGRLRKALAVVEIAAALVLMTGAGLLLRTLMSLNAVDAGYRADNVLTMSIGVPVRRFSSERELSAYYERIERELAAVPGVRVASLTSNVPLDGRDFGQWFEVVGRPSPDPPSRPAAHYQMVSPRYFDALGIQIIRGRGLTDDDTSTSTPVAVVNEELARRYLSAGDPIGARVSVQAMALAPGAPIVREIVGVIRQVKTRPEERENVVEIYVPLAQNSWYNTTLAVQTAGNPMAVLPAIKAAIARIDPLQLATRVRTMEDVAGESTARPRFRAQLIGTFAALALVLAAVGIFSVLTFTVQQRARELSIRMALGAGARDILALVLGGGLRLTALGLGIGLTASAALVRSLATLLFAVKPIDPITFAAAPALLGLIALAACAAPAIRATRSDPAAVLRAE